MWNCHGKRSASSPQMMRAGGTGAFLRGGSLMYFVALVLTVLAALFYAAGQHEIGWVGVDMCRYGGTFCDSPIYVLTGALLAAVWGKFVSIR
jgi:hypothetical protein